MCCVSVHVQRNVLATRAHLQTYGCINQNKMLFPRGRCCHQRCGMTVGQTYAFIQRHIRTPALSKPHVHKIKPPVQTASGPAPIATTCDYKDGGGTGGSEEQFGATTTAAECTALVKSARPTGACYAEFGMIWKRCLGVLHV